MSDDLRAYFERIEAAFCRRRGAPLLLSPLDFEKAVEWFAAGVEPEVVEDGIDLYFKKLESRKVPLRRAICLSFAEESVLRAREARRAAAVGRAAGLEERPPEGERVREFLGSRAKALRAFKENPEASAAMPVLARFATSAADAVEGLIPKADGPPARLEATLGPLDVELGNPLSASDAPCNILSNASSRGDVSRRRGKKLEDPNGEEPEPNDHRDYECLGPTFPAKPDSAEGQQEK